MKIVIENLESNVGINFLTFGGEWITCVDSFDNVNDALSYVNFQINDAQQYLAASIYSANTGELFVTCYADDCDDVIGYDVDE